MYDNARPFTATIGHYTITSRVIRDLSNKRVGVCYTTRDAYGQQVCLETETPMEPARWLIDNNKVTFDDYVTYASKVYAEYSAETADCHPFPHGLHGSDMLF